MPPLCLGCLGTPSPARTSARDKYQSSCLTPYFIFSFFFYLSLSALFFHSSLYIPFWSSLSSLLVPFSLFLFISTLSPPSSCSSSHCSAQIYIPRSLSLPTRALLFACRLLTFTFVCIVILSLSLNSRQHRHHLPPPPCSHHSSCRPSLPLSSPLPASPRPLLCHALMPRLISSSTASWLPMLAAAAVSARATS